MATKRSVMVDIETLSTQSDACVISIGVAEFIDGQVTRTEGWAIDSKDWHGHIDPRTIKWWMEQEAAAREYSFNGKTPARQVAQEFKAFIDGADEVWANSPQFDLTILRSWWKRIERGDQFPVSYRNERDCRTIFNEARRTGVHLDNCWLGSSVAHNPIDDAANQARAIIQWRKAMPGVHE